MNKKILEFIIIVVLIIAVIIVMNFNENKCVKNGGKVITDNLGVYEKCVYGDE